MLLDFFLLSPPPPTPHPPQCFAKTQRVLAQLRAGNVAEGTVFVVVFLLNVLQSFCAATSSNKRTALEFVPDNRFSQI